jgi:hypothetical protein
MYKVLKTHNISPFQKGVLSVMDTGTGKELRVVKINNSNDTLFYEAGELIQKHSVKVGGLSANGSLILY